MATLEHPFEKVRPKLVAARIELMSKLAKFEPEELRWVPAEGSWSALEVAHHIYIADGLMLEALERIEQEENPLLEDPEQKAPRVTQDSTPPVSLDAVLGGMAARREELFEYLRALAPEVWERPWRHPEAGELKFYQLVNTEAHHDRVHAHQLEELKSAIQTVRSETPGGSRA